MGDIVDHLSQGNLRDIVPESWATSTASEIVRSIVAVLQPLTGMAEALMQATTRVKEDIFESIDIAALRFQKSSHDDPKVGLAAFLSAFEGNFSSGLQEVLDGWGQFHAVFANTTGRLVGGLNSSGQVGLAKLLNRSFRASDAAMTNFTRRVQRAAEQVLGCSSLARRQLGAALGRSNAELYEALRSASAFGPAAFGKPMQDLVDRVSDALSTVGIFPERVQRTLAEVEHLATSVQVKLRTASRELVLGGHQALAAVAKRAGLQDPGWPPPGVQPVVPDPLREDEAGSPWSSWFSGDATGLRGPGSLVWLLFGFFLSASA